MSSLENRNLLELVESLLSDEKQGSSALAELQSKSILTMKDFLRINTDRRQKKMRRASMALHNILLGVTSEKREAFVRIAASLRGGCKGIKEHQGSAQQRQMAARQQNQSTSARSISRDQSVSWQTCQMHEPVPGEKHCRCITTIAHKESLQPSSNEFNICFQGRDITVGAGMIFKRTLTCNSLSDVRGAVSLLDSQQHSCSSTAVLGVPGNGRLEVGGYDAVFIPPLPERLLCSICCMGLREPVRSTCGHLFCRLCISSLSCDQGLLCPVGNCRSSLTNEPMVQLVIDEACAMEVHSWQVKCYAADRGCLWQGPLSDFKEHGLLCPEVSVCCPNRCGAVVRRKEVGDHCATDCEDEIVTCQFVQQGCPVKTKRRKLPQHNSEASLFHLELVDAARKELVRQLSNARQREHLMRMLLFSRRNEPHRHNSLSASHMVSAHPRRCTSVAHDIHLHASNDDRCRQDTASNDTAGLAAAAFRSRCYSH